MAPGESEKSLAGVLMSMMESTRTDSLLEPAQSSTASYKL